jgi:transcriptional regulator with XRE-family HTH domain
MLAPTGGDRVITMDNDRPDLGKRIASLRGTRGWSQSDLAMRVGMSPRTVGEYERAGPKTYKLGLFNAVFDGELLRGTVFDGAASNGTKVPVPVEDDVLAPDMAADQEAVTGGVEPLGLLLDGVLARLRAMERAVADLEKKCADR